MSMPSTTHEIRTTFSSSEWRQPCRQFTCSEIQQATRNFDDSLIIGRGGFGKVYRGTITIGPNLFNVAIKRLDSTSNQGASEFWAEVNMLSNLRHCHLVSLIGYCNDENEMILVYEYMSNGTLEDHLHKQNTPLSWIQRLTICIGAARGLDYLHTGTGIKHGVVHRDVKSSNILLHRSWDAKIADFGLSKICPKNQQITYINTGIKGTFGYLDPDYFYTGKLTRKSDVYAFGVVLFEVLCGKRAVDRRIDEDNWGLAIWAQESIKEGRLKEIVDSDIRGVVSPKCLKKFAEVAKRCLDKNPKQRPTMAALVVGLESILAFQEKANRKLQPTREASKVKFLSDDQNTEDNGLNSLELYFDTVGGENQTLCRFDFKDINVATDFFYEANKISQHTSDSWYKGELSNGQIIAIVESFYGTGRKEYSMNEASILVKLEHENVAKLLGYCIQGTRLFLVYDFSLHSILDHLMFDPECTILNWDKRYKIILDVARALLYLHRDAPIRVIHCDVKPGNILLDESLNPILSSFWIAKCLAINETDRHESRINGTWGYMAPEYMKNGDLSTKTDVYSFGVLVLEFMTARRAGIDISLEMLREKWLERTLADIIDLRIDVDSIHITRLLEIGLLCAQEDAEDRPTMDEVVSMLLDSSSLNLPMAKMRELLTTKFSESSSAPEYYVYYDDPYDYDTGAVKEFILELFPR
ncbi:uncharacterized protein LOC143538756 [Bidens hawaiensis]|uniref:uncharacterized protein LOC143538756 n=1 Tax=Bidens hawaiensis TaxID=980011 RepID=UPI00404A8FEA